MKILKLAPLLLVSALQAAPQAHTSATLGVLPTSQIMTAVTLHSRHHYYFSSDAEGNKLFNFKISLCPDTQPQNCVVHEDHLWLVKGQHYERTIDLERTVVFHAIGSKSVTAITEVSGGAYSFAVQQGYVDVHY